ncbi:serine/threonine-protein kinase [Nakamurella multipartita]|jgi:serine/threonine-protein kinase|uniref:non-specific serine/threonine protein kinase n=1 Tax=Nakamurella multipartita (strain ATCC 700099 / DSM 44233 / CIP 104796 / JCM 9543 / NBRC 105858 / Y-104) TaxID=479431 RepID=C8X6I7_NAKMY|nr:serine/threonine-protein kinase [Nakamurella multipartita]ACV78842.1 serine/threonine protein kinase [Nakamurella multipartita DSM 44233]
MTQEGGDATPGPPHHLPAGTMVGSYRVESLLDRGGMAYVYEATDVRLDRRVALKILAWHDPDGSDFRERFLRESRFAASLDHPNIVPIYEAGETDGLLYIAMRFVRGTNLSRLIRRDGPLDPQRALAILAPVADALDLAHAAGLVHRDVKPANILLADSGDGRQHVYLSDFGLTKRAAAMSRLTEAGSFIGTMAYVSPEQIRGEPLDARSDLYALGCVAYECLAGAPPFVRDDQAALMWAHLSQYPAPLAESRRELAAADPVIMKAVAKDPADRFATGREFTTALAAALTGVAPAAPPGDDLPTTVGVRPATGTGGSAPSAAPSGPSASPSGPFTGPGSAPHHPSSPSAFGNAGPPAGPPRSGPPSGSHRRPSAPSNRKPVIIALVAAVLAVATITGVTWAVRSNSQVQGQAQAQPPSAEHSHEAALDGTGSPGGSSASAAPANVSPSPVESAGPPSTAPPETAPTVAVAPAPAVAIPSIAGDPIAVGATPGYVAITPDGRFAYIANRAAKVVTVLDTTINKVTATIPIDAGPPQFIAFSPDGSRAYVSVYNDDKTINLVVVINTRTTKALTEVPVEKKPYALAVTPDGTSVWVPSHDAGALDIIDVATDTVVQTLPVAKNPHWVAFSPDGRTAYLANHESNVLSVIDVASRAVLTTIPVGTSPHSVAVSPDGTQVVVVCFDSNDVYFIDTATDQVLGTIPVGTNPQDISYSADGQYLYTANVQSNTVSVIDAATRQVTATIPVDSPTSIGVLPNGRFAYVTNLNAGTLTVLNTTS